MPAVEILATGPDIVKKGVRGIEPVIEGLIQQATREIHIIAYLITPSALGILEMLEQAAERGVRIVIVVNDLQSQNKAVVQKLTEISDEYPHVNIADFIGGRNRPLHAKILVADRKAAFVGSANLSWGGMFSNYEIGLLVQGKVAWKLSEIADRLASKYMRK